jgi:addiction module HigA family antidote
MFNQLTEIKGIHPGLFLERELKKRNIQKGKFAISLGEHPQTLVAITKMHRRMNTPLALKIEHVLGLEEGFLMVLQAYYDIEQEKDKRKMMHPDFSKFRTALFWDTDMQTIDWHKQKISVINRVFDRGNEIERAEIIRFYGREVVDEILAHYEI